MISKNKRDACLDFGCHVTRHLQSFIRFHAALPLLLYIKRSETPISVHISGLLTLQLAHYSAQRLFNVAHCRHLRSSECQFVGRKLRGTAWCLRLGTEIRGNYASEEAVNACFEVALMWKHDNRLAFGPHCWLYCRSVDAVEPLRCAILRQLRGQFRQAGLFKEVNDHVPGL